LPAGASRQSLGDERFHVYFGACDSFAPNVRREVERSPRVEWTAADEVRVTFSIFRSLIAPAEVKLRRLDASRSVHVQFVITQTPSLPASGLRD
jgi:hypothetical protein